MQPSEIEELQAKLVSEQKRVLQLNQEMSSRDERNREERSVLQRDLESLRHKNNELKAELSDARQQLSDMAASMQNATKTVMSLKQVYWQPCVLSLSVFY